MCFVPEGNRLGKEGEGFRIAMQTLDGGRIGIAAQALGIAEGAMEETVKYIQERIQFGRPIGSFQGIQWYIADMETRINAARYLMYNAVYRKKVGEPYSKEAAMAKLYASETAMFVTHKAIQLHGGYGFIKDYPVERMLRDAKITEIYEVETDAEGDVFPPSEGCRGYAIPFSRDGGVLATFCHPVLHKNHKKDDDHENRTQGHGRRILRGLPSKKVEDLRSVDKDFSRHPQE